MNKEPPCGQRLRFNLAVMFAKNRQANAQAQTGTATGALCGEEGIKNLRQNLSSNTRAIILKSGHDTIGSAADPDAKGAMITSLSNGLLGIGDQVEEHLSELAGVAEDERNIGLSGKIDRNAIRAQRMFVKLQAALNQFAQIEANLARLGRARKSQEALHDLSGAARLAMGNFELPARGIIFRGIAQKFGHAEHRGERIIQLMGDAGNHLAHSRKPFVLNQLLLHALGVGRIACRRDNAGDAAGSIHKRARGSPEQAGFTIVPADEKFGTAIGALSGNNAIQECLDFVATVRFDALAEKRPNQLFR